MFFLAYKLNQPIKDMLEWPYHQLKKQYDLLDAQLDAENKAMEKSTKGSGAGNKPSPRAPKVPSAPKIRTPRSK